MNKSLRQTLNNLWSEDRALQNITFSRMLASTQKPVDWAYEIWDELLENLSHQDNHNRAIAAQVLCNLAKSDPENRMQKDFAALLALTKDERFVTARHCMQALWKVGLVGEAQKKLLMAGLATRFKECLKENNSTLIRYDICVVIKKVFDGTQDEKLRAAALALIETETDLKYRKKYAGVWK